MISLHPQLSRLALLSLLSLATPALRAEDAAAPKSPAPMAQPAQPEAPKERRFDLDFPGGSPTELIAAISKAQGSLINVVLGNGNEKVHLQPIHVNQVTASELFLTLNTVGQFPGRARFQIIPTNSANHEIKLWSFVIQDINTYDSEFQQTRFFQLAPYLDTGLTVDDITTAVETAWKMEERNERPKLCFHKETKLLIVVGKVDAIKTVQAALDALPKNEDPKQKTATASSTTGK